MNKPIPTVLNAPLSDSELTDEEIAPQEQLEREQRKEWFNKTLDKMFVLAVSDSDLNEEFCRAAEILKQKPKPRSDHGRFMLLIDYGHAVMRFGDESDKVEKYCIDKHREVYGSCLSPEYMQNRISESITMALKGKLPELPEPLMEIIKARRGRYRHTTD